MPAVGSTQGSPSTVEDERPARCLLQGAAADRWRRPPTWSTARRQCPRPTSGRRRRTGDSPLSCPARNLRPGVGTQSWQPRRRSWAQVRSPAVHARQAASSVDVQNSISGLSLSLGSARCATLPRISLCILKRPVQAEGWTFQTLFEDSPPSPSPRPSSVQIRDQHPDVR